MEAASLPGGLPDDDDVSPQLRHGRSISIPVGSPPPPSPKDDSARRPEMLPSPPPSRDAWLGGSTFASGMLRRKTALVNLQTGGASRLSSASRDDKESTPLRRLVVHKRFETLSLTVVLLNCIFLANEDPTQEEDMESQLFIAQRVCTWFFAVEVRRKPSSCCCCCCCCCS